MKNFIERAIELAKANREPAGRQSRRDAELLTGPDASRGTRRRRTNVGAPEPPELREKAPTGSLLPPIDLLNVRSIGTDPALLRQNLVLTAEDSRAPSGNAYRTLRTRVMRQMRKNGWRRLGVTATQQGEGKTLTAINLALAVAAERTQPVVLIDLDLRRSSVYRHLGLSEGQFTNLGDYLQEEAGSLDELVVSLAEQGLFCILNGRSIERSSDLLASPQGQAFVSEVAQRLPDAMLIFDLPPLLVTDDSLVVAPQMDAFLMVVAENGPSREDVAKAARLLAEFNLLGAVLNKSSERSQPSYYY